MLYSFISRDFSYPNTISSLSLSSLFYACLDLWTWDFPHYDYFFPIHCDEILMEAQVIFCEEKKRDTERTSVAVTLQVLDRCRRRPFVILNCKDCIQMCIFNSHLRQLNEQQLYHPCSWMANKLWHSTTYRDVALLTCIYCTLRSR